MDKISITKFLENLKKNNKDKRQLEEQGNAFNSELIKRRPFDKETIKSLFKKFKS